MRRLRRVTLLQSTLLPMSAQSDLIDFFRLDATFDPSTHSTREVIQISDRAQLKRRVVTVKEWKRQVEPIGHGGSGIIWLEHDEDGKERVVKQIFKATPTISLQTDYKRELQALGRLSKHQDLFVHFYGWFENDTSIFLSMEYFELGDLEKFITPKLTETDARVIGRQLLEGLRVLHEYRLAHRDLKPANIFVARCAPDWWIKLGDFGILRGICTAQNSTLTRIGTPDYMAPEMLFDNDNEDQDSPYTLAVDIWSLGCVLFRLLSQQLPFPQIKHLRLYWQSRKPFPTDILTSYGVSGDGVSLISEMMKSNPADRVTVTTALLHSWVSTQESTLALGDLDSFQEIVEYELHSKSAKKGSATKSSMPIKNHNIQDENQEHLLSNDNLTSSENDEMLKPRERMPDQEERIFDSHDEDTDILESRSSTANDCLKLGRYKEAMQLFQQILEARQRLLGDEHPDTLKAMNDLAKSFAKHGRYQEAMLLYKQTLEVRKLILGDKHPDCLQSMHGLAASYLDLGQHQEAMDLDKQTLELQKRILGEEHPDTLDSMHTLASSYFKLGQLQEAMHLCKETLQLRKRILGDEHPNTLQSMHNLAAYYSHLGQHQKAMDLDKQTFELRKRILGDKHPDTFWSMHNLAAYYSHLGQHQEAIDLDQQTLELRKRIMGDEHPHTLKSMHSLALSYSRLGQHQEAMHLHKQTLELRKRILGDEHPDTLQSMNRLAAFYSKLGQDQEAIHLCKQTFQLQKRILGDEHPDTLQSMHRLAAFYFNLGQDQEAKDLRKQTLELRKRILGEEHPDTLQSMHSLARSYSRLGGHQKATHLFKQTLELQKLILSDKHPDTLQSMHNLAGSYSNLGQHQEAKQLYKQTLELRKSILGDEHPDTLQSMYNLAGSYSSLGRHREANQLRKQTVQARQRFLDSAHSSTISSAKTLTSVSANEQTSQREGARTKAPRRISRYLPFLNR